CIAIRPMATETGDQSAPAAPSGDSAAAAADNLKASPVASNGADSPAKSADEKMENSEPDGASKEANEKKQAAKPKPKASPTQKSRRPAESPAPPTPSREGMRRDRKKVERLSEVIDKQYQQHVDSRVVLPQGRGTKLRDCPRVLYFMYQSKPDDLKLLHSLIFNRSGVANEIRKNLLEFNGFEFSKDSKEFERLVDRAASRKVKELKKSLFALDLERSQGSGGGTRDMAQRLCEFLVKPFDNGKKPPKKLSFQLMQEGRGGKKKSSKSSKSKSAASSSKSAGKKKKPAKKAAASSGSEGEEEEDDQVSSSSSSGSDASDSDDSDAKKKKKKLQKTKKKTPAKKAASPAKRQPAGGASRKRKASVSSDSDGGAAADSSDEDDMPLKKLKTAPEEQESPKKPPTDEEIKQAVADVLAKADLDNLMLSQAIKQVYAKFEPIDISDRKQFIKDAIKELM
ncbi:hypothetical protein BOX15_Mlig024736g2, partial [Macrostomum lignano]